MEERDQGEKAPAPAGPPARWVTVVRTYDAADMLISERVTEVREVPVTMPEAQIPGLYL